MFVQQIFALLLLTIVSMAAVTAAYPGWLDRSYPYPEGKPSPDLYDYGDSRADDVSPLKADGSDDEFTQTLEALRKRAQMIRLPAKRRNYPLIKLKKSKCTKCYEFRFCLII